MPSPASARVTAPRLAILRALRADPQTTWQLAAALDRQYQALYCLLRDMRAAGLVATRTVPRPGGSEFEWSLTAAGRRASEREPARPVRRKPAVVDPRYRAPTSYTPGAEPPAPTRARPDSRAKLYVMRARVRRGYSPFHPKDAGFGED